MGDMELQDQTTISDGVNNTLPRLLLLGEQFDLVQRCDLGTCTRAFECERWIDGSPPLSTAAMEVHPNRVPSPYLTPLSCTPAAQPPQGD